MAILVASAPLPAAPYVDALRRAAPGVPVWTEADAPPPDAVEALLAWRLRPGQVAQYPALRVVCSVAAGTDKLLAVPDLPPALPVTRVVDPAQALQMAQFALACALAHTRELERYAAQQAAARWERHPVRPAERCRVGLLGLGAVGQAMAQAFLAVGYPVAGWSRRPRTLPGVRAHCGSEGLAALLAETDLLVGALPLTAETRGLLDRERLGRLPRGAYVIHLGRGEQLVEADLRALLDEGHLAGAALDVFEREPPPPDDWVWRHPRVRATPHIAAQASFDTVAAQCLEAWRQVRAGERPARAVDRAAGY
ncbi:2-hydroxyacid dehydrogenase [Piscinibacter sakaiensis]|uniref:D-3-phosphoglycerate dehydrogenase n=1 Tax=Piscinibacter sakaiensis TaxID=1547922 RepID=A0A0K8NVU3_PISS1|nr:glyoxylate/hydroxypyruvate reductase A [Piscinibacter sakaiensis]GAP34506.1 D-3-phosphoglycerate dehydrogenase [Piscinibacter sakaiensis]